MQPCAAGKLLAGHTLASSVLLTAGLFLSEILSPFRTVSRAQVGLLRKPARCSKGLTYLQSFCENLQALAGGEIEVDVLLESFPSLLGFSVSLCLLTRDEPRMSVLLLVSRSLKTLSTGSQGTVIEAMRQLVTVRTDPALSSHIQGSMVQMSERMCWWVSEAGPFWMRSSVLGKPTDAQNSHKGSASP